MKKLKPLLIFAAFNSLLFFAACNQSASDNNRDDLPTEKQIDMMENDTSSLPSPDTVYSK